MMNQGMVCFLDVYGYSADASGGDAEESASALIAMWKRIAKRLDEVENCKYGIFSDSIFIGFDRDDPSQIHELTSRLIPSIESIMSIAVEHGYLLRGAFAYGGYLIEGNIVGGPALIRAHKLEQVIPIPAFLLQMAEARKLEIDCTKVVPITFGVIRTKGSGITKGKFLFPSQLDDFISLLEMKLEAAYLNNQYDLANSFKEAINAARQ